jgi:hypothetical protein
VLGRVLYHLSPASSPYLSLVRIYQRASHSLRLWATLSLFAEGAENAGELTRCLREGWWSDPLLAVKQRFSILLGTCIAG